MNAQPSSSQEEQIKNLQALRDHTLDEIERLERELQETIEPASATDDDSADVAADVYERGKIISLVQNLQAKVHAIDHALEAAMRGQYGICEKCGAVIPAERLEIMPETTRPTMEVAPSTLSKAEAVTLEIPASSANATR